MAVDYEALERIGRDLLIALGEDPDRAGIAETPMRWAKMWREFIDYDPGKIGTVFDSVAVDQLVIVSGMDVWSMCEHHLLPFSSKISIGYLAGKNVVGLSKFARIAHKHAHNLQLQERLVEGIAQEVKEIAGTDNVAVVGSGVHLCMVMRGIKTPGVMTSSAMHGTFRESAALRAEFMELIKYGTQSQG